MDSIILLIKTYRINNNISQREFAKIMHCNNSYIARIEKGLINHLSLRFLVRLSLIIDVQLLDLLVLNGDLNYNEI